MRNQYKNFTAVILSLLFISLFGSCKKFLDEQPSKSALLVVKTTDDLNGLLNAQNNFYLEPNNNMIYGTDDYGLTTQTYDAGPNVFNSLTNLQFMLWDIQNIPTAGNDTFWSGEFTKIFTANLVLSNVDKVTGTESEKVILRADAHFVRAYSYWQLANTYCLPYTEKNKQEMGLPIKLTTSFEEDLHRQSLEKVYQLIESDLSEALKIPVGIAQSGKIRQWRASKAAVNAFAARYYLNRNDNAKTVQYADAALSDYSTLVDYNTQMKYGRDENVTINPGTASAQAVVIKYPYTHNNQSDQTDMLGWKETLYYRFLSNPNWWYMPSKSLLDTYDKAHDLRYLYHIVEGYSYNRGMTKPAYDYPGYIFFFKDKITSGPTVAEVLLTKAEAQARLGLISESMATVNILRSKRMLPGAWVNLSASSKEEAITNILNERRREMPFIQRWYDIRRFNNNDDPNDDVTLSRTFYQYTTSAVVYPGTVKTYSLTKDSRRFAVPIPQSDITSSNGDIEQNKY